MTRYEELQGKKDAIEALASGETDVNILCHLDAAAREVAMLMVELSIEEVDNGSQL